MKRTSEEIIAIIQTARQLKLPYVIIDDVKYPLDLDNVIKSNQVPELKAEEIVKPVSVFDDLTEDEVLYWSTPFYDELQYIKEQKQKKAEGNE